MLEAVIDAAEITVHCMSYIFYMSRQDNLANRAAYPHVLVNNVHCLTLITSLCLDSFDKIDKV